MKQLFQKVKRPASAKAWLRLAAYTLPLVALVTVLYLNYLPFGYDRSFVIQAGVAGDRDGEFRLVQTRDGFSERLVTPEGIAYREVAGSAFALFDPRAYLRDARATVEIDADGIVMIPPSIAFDPSSYEWAYVQPEDLSSPGCTLFDGARVVPVPDNAGGVGEGAFMLYAEWTPEDANDGYQRIVGGTGFDLLQNKDDVKLTLGSSTIEYRIDDDEFFSARHAALVVYVPPTTQQENGRIDLFVDSRFAGRIYFQEASNPVAVTGTELTLGKSPADEASFFSGCLHDMRIRPGDIDVAADRITFPITRTRSSYPITLIATGAGTGVLRSMTLHAVQD